MNMEENDHRLTVGIPQQGDLEAGESLLLAGVRSLYFF